MKRSTHPSTVEVLNAEQLRIYALPTNQVIQIDRAIRVDKTTVFVGKDGRLYCPRVGPGNYYRVNDWGFTTPLMNALVKLKIISRKVANEHLAEVKRRSERDDARHDLNRLLEIAATHALKISATQIAKLEKKAEAGK